MATKVHKRLRFFKGTAEMTVKNSIQNSESKTHVFRLRGVVCPRYTGHLYISYIYRKGRLVR